MSRVLWQYVDENAGLKIKQTDEKCLVQMYQYFQMGSVTVIVLFLQGVHTGCVCHQSCLVQQLCAVCVRTVLKSPDTLHSQLDSDQSYLLLGAAAAWESAGGVVLSDTELQEKGVFSLGGWGLKEAANCGWWPRPWIHWRVVSLQWER